MLLLPNTENARPLLEYCLRNARCPALGTASSAADATLVDQGSALLQRSRPPKDIGLELPTHVGRAARGSIAALVAACHEVVLVGGATDLLCAVPDHGGEVPRHAGGTGFACHEMNVLTGWNPVVTEQFRGEQRDSVQLPNTLQIK